jgi:hypothetical protein
MGCLASTCTALDKEDIGQIEASGKTLEKRASATKNQTLWPDLIDLFRRSFPFFSN